MPATTVTARNGYEIADFICEQVAEHDNVYVNGREVWSLYGLPRATVYANGTIEVRVRGRKPNTQGSLFAKVGDDISIEVW